MLGAILPYLMTAGQASVAYQGGKVILQGAEDVTGVPVARVFDCFVKTIVDDVRGTFQGVTSPVVAGIESTAAYFISTDRALPREPAIAATAGVNEDPDDILREAEQKRYAGAHFASKNMSKAALLTAGSRDQVEMVNEARASSRLAKLSKRLEARARALGNSIVSGAGDANSSSLQTLRMAYANAALDAAEASENPPTDPRDVLASDAVSGDEKAAITYIIDAVNRDQEPDYDVLANKYVLANSYTPELPQTAGHDHGHAHDGAACACGGSCGPCAAKKAPKKSAAGWDDKIIAPAAMDVAGVWDDKIPAVKKPAPANPNGPWTDAAIAKTKEDVAGWGDTNVPTEMPQANWMNPQAAAGCTTGCPVPVRRKR